MNPEWENGITEQNSHSCYLRQMGISKQSWMFGWELLYETPSHFLVWRASGREESAMVTRDQRPQFLLDSAMESVLVRKASSFLGFGFSKVRRAG